MAVHPSILPPAAMLCGRESKTFGASVIWPFKRNVDTNTKQQRKPRQVTIKFLRDVFCVNFASMALIRDSGLDLLFDRPLVVFMPAAVGNTGDMFIFLEPL